ncbi:hypothetical protein SAMN05444007_11427 [Cribrihabitans marinus]|uniref:Phage integrase family protein n=1 Tax=Cribrihabitans marinus TaxID=1227549 RepID=A0A1H7E3Q8_9RHOB|nr:hypothetical protein [Cribrihabitans marinus]GGH40265.1 hypothetical protein GCM10010973_36590 [Cribrihabitans marinus]SEK05215.1 hypothetical protein SAMN05444007_11427 [Cribrihabitans marinus]
MAGVAHTPHLEKRPSGYFFRRRLPKAWVEISNPGQSSAICLSLRTDVLSEATCRVRALTALTDLAVALTTERPVNHLSAEHVTLLTELARCQIAAHEALRASAEPRSEAAANFAAQAERATQDMLRRALALGDRSPVTDPLREMARQFGVTLDETSSDWRALAFEALRVMLDVSRERERREVGTYEEATPIFRSVMASRSVSPAAGSPVVLAQAPAPALAVPAATAPAVSPVAVPAMPAATTAAEPQLACPVQNQVETTGVAPETAAPIVENNSSHAPSSQERAPVPAAKAQETAPMRSAMSREEPQILIDQSLLSDEARAALAKGPNIELREAFDLYFELKELGYGDLFKARQKRFPDKGRNWVRSSRGNARKARDIWVDVLGNQPFHQIDWTEIDGVLNVIRRIPKYHGKKKNLLNLKGFRDLVERADEQELAAATAAREELAAKGIAKPADLERADVDAKIPRLRVATFLRHGRMANRVGKMLEAMKLIDENPFEICSWTNDEEKALKANEDDRSRMLWDDKIQKLFASPVYQGQCEEKDYPLFWGPLIARLAGCRAEEILQLAPEDFGSENGIAYFTVRNVTGNHVKSTAGERRIAVHPKLVELGLLQFVEMRRRQKQSRLFPDLNRGKTKDTFSELYSKTFGYYRKTNDCYWPGLDFHAFRTTFHNDLGNLLCPDMVRRRIMGHEKPVDEGDGSYTREIWVKTLHEVISRIDLDISRIKSPFAASESAAPETVPTQIQGDHGNVVGFRRRPA